MTYNPNMQQNNVLVNIIAISSYLLTWLAKYYETTCDNYRFKSLPISITIIGQYYGYQVSPIVLLVHSSTNQQ